MRIFWARTFDYDYDYDYEHEHEHEHENIQFYEYHIMWAATNNPLEISTESAISLRGVSKHYSRSDARADTLKESMLASLSRREQRDVIVALEDVNLEIRRGESVGLIGPNGSGKSTMLKLIAGISRPTRGTVTADGRVIGMIELGTGFHPDLSGEENIRLQGAIYGLTAEQVESRIESILDFAELRDFRALPVKHYSSGMFVRLGFAIAVHTEPDILLVDEVLSVGDQTFQERCIRRIRELLAGGVTLVFVTHFPEQAERLCQRVAWLEEGRVRAFGPASRVLADYHNDLIQRRYNKSEGALDLKIMKIGQPGRFGSGEARIEEVRVLSGDGQPRAHFRRGEAMRVEVDYQANEGIEALDCMIPLEYPLYGTMLTLWWAENRGVLARPVNGRGTCVLDVEALDLLPGRYCLTVSLTPPGKPYDHYDVLYKLIYFAIEPEPDWETIAPVELKSEGIIKGSS